ncbi:hypothetical protein FOZ62_016401, partial [Perkinsus olseni]
ELDEVPITINVSGSLFLRVRVDKSAVVRRQRPKLNSAEERLRMPNSSTVRLEKKNINTRALTPTQGDKIVYHAFRASLFSACDGCCARSRTSAMLDDLGETQSTQSDIEERNKPGIPLPE